MGIKESFTNLAHTTAEDRVAVTNLTDANRHLASQVAAQANNMADKDAVMETTKKIINNSRGNSRP